MAQINVKKGNSVDFDRVLRLIQGATGCVVQILDDIIRIFSFDDFHALIMDTIVSNTDAVIVNYEMI